MNRYLIKAIQHLVGRRGYSLYHQSDLIHDDRYLDKREFRYILWINEVYRKIQNVPGHVVELGVARGRNSILFANLMEIYGESHLRKYYGFDTFSGYTQEDLNRDTHLPTTAWTSLSAEWVNLRLQRAGYEGNCTLIEGDLVETLPKFLKEMPNFRAALVYIDCNAYRPSLFAMETLKKFMAPGGIICIDELRQGGETKALIEFCENNNLQYVKDSSPLTVPAYTMIK